MSEISNNSDDNTTTSSSKTKPCSLIRYGCKIDEEESTSSEEHYTSEQHQRSLVKLTQQIIEKEKSNSEIDNINKQTEIYFRENYAKLSTAIQTIETSNDQLLRSNSDILQLNNQFLAFEDELNDAKVTNSLEKVHIDGMLINQNVLTQDTITMKQHVENRRSKHQILDGAMLWKISDIREKLLDSQSERRTSIYSPSFYTSATGYNLCIRLYFNGDGNARGTHLSIFLVVLRGQYDALLQWPFSYRVSFCLYDQRTMIESNDPKQAQHIIESFRPDIRSISFQKPSSSMNIASGIPKFLSLDNFNQPADINRYIINDTIFIKMFIDFIGIPKSILPFIFRLNAGLPIKIQQQLINEEIKRREEQAINSE